MPTSPHLNAAASAAGRLRSARVDDGIVAGYIHELARPLRDASDASPPAVRSPQGSRRLRTTGRRPGLDRPRSWGRRGAHPIAGPAAG